MNNLRRFIDLVERVGKDQALDRTVFLYLEPKSNPDQHAQCASCFMFMPGKQRCSIFSENDRVVANASCNLYAAGKPNDNQEIKNSVTPSEAGYIEAQVRCENCSWFNQPNNCGFFADLNKAMPAMWKLDETVDPKGCCNAWQA
jgi:hypothetical protein